MANVQVRNTATGQTLSIPEDQVPFMSSQWKVDAPPVAPVAPTQTQPAATNQTGQKFYRVGADIYNAATNQKIGATDWANNWSGKASEVPAPAAASQTTPKPTPTPITTEGGSSKIETGATKTEKQQSKRNTENIEVPTELANNEYFKSLDADNQSMVAYYWNILSSQNEEKKAAFQKSLDLATQQADPYWKEKFNIVKTELGQTLGNADANMASTEADLMRRKNEIENSLTSEREYLTAEQQAELARQSTNLSNDIEAVRERMAASGLSSSSIRNRAEEKTQAVYKDVIESSNRTYARQKENLESTAASNVATVLQQVKDLQMRTGQAKQSAVGEVENYLGSSELASLPGVAEYLKGNVTGTAGESKTSDILARAQGLLAKNYGF